MTRTPSIARRLGTIYLALATLLLAVSVVVVNHLAAMRKDSERLLEETDEYARTTALSLHIGALGQAVQDLHAKPADPDQLARLARVFERIEDSARELGASDDKDPSRADHQAYEEQTVEELLTLIGEIKVSLLGLPSSGDASATLDLLLEADARARHLLQETRAEAYEANREIVGLGRDNRFIMVVTAVGTALVLGLTFLYVHRTVIKPLRALKRGADLLGRGDFEHRIAFSGDDELASLARSFNDMAGRVGASHQDLEDTVHRRTSDFLRAAKLADLGVLAAGVAHEVNTPLASIASCAEGLERRLQRGECSEDDELFYLRTIAQEAYRARDITTQLLILANQEPAEAASVSIDPLLAQVELSASGQLAEKGVNLKLACEPGLAVHGNGAELMQILMNLLRNARDASADGDVIELRVRGEGDWIVFEVEDHGTGMDPDAVERAFAPFYTTKAAGEGTGLGLPIVASLVDARGGELKVESAVGSGTTFTVRLPAGAEQRSPAEAAR